MSTREASRVALADLPGQYREIRDDVEVALARVLANQRFVLGPEVDAFEAEFARRCGAAFVCGCASGSDALLLALMALDVGPGDEVLCPAFGFFATAAAIVRLGARPVFTDIEPATYNLDVALARETARAHDRLRALLPVDLFGQVANLQACLALGRELELPVVEDAAQSVAALDLQGHRAGSRATLGCFSFYPSKNLGAFGDAGAVVTSDPALAARIRLLRVHGAAQPFIHHQVGINSRLDSLQAAVLRVKLERLEGWTKARRENASFYDRSFADAGAVPAGESPRDGALPLQIPRPAPQPARHVYHHYAVRVPAARRDSLRGDLASAGIETAVFYPTGLHQQPCFSALGYKAGDFPVTEAAARESLVLPIHPGLRADQLSYVVEQVLTSLRR